MRRRILMCLAVLLLLSGMGAASASDVLAAQSEALDLDALQDAAGGYLPDGALEAGISLDEGLQTILDTGSGQISGVVRKAVRSGVLLLTVVLLCGLAEGLYGGMGVSQTTDVVAIVGALAITAVAVADANSLIGMGREALEQMETFSKILLPTITAAAARRRLSQWGSGPPTGHHALFRHTDYPHQPPAAATGLYLHSRLCGLCGGGERGAQAHRRHPEVGGDQCTDRGPAGFCGLSDRQRCDCGLYRRGNRQGGQIYHVQPGSGGRRYPVRRGGNRIGRGRNTEKCGGGVRACLRCCACAWRPSSSSVSTT